MLRQNWDDKVKILNLILFESIRPKTKFLFKMYVQNTILSRSSFHLNFDIIKIELLKYRKIVYKK